MEAFSDRRLAENEVIFKELNGRLKTAIDKNLMGQAGDMPLEFYCECSDEDCRERIRIDQKEFTAAHSSTKRFITKIGHEVLAIEKVVFTSDSYSIVEKNVEPPQKTNMKLNKTDL